MCKYIDELKKVNYTKSKIAEIAKKYELTTSELKKYYQTKFFQNISEHINLDELSQINLEEIVQSLFLLQGLFLQGLIVVV